MISAVVSLPPGAGAADMHNLSFFTITSKQPKLESGVKFSGGFGFGL